MRGEKDLYYLDDTHLSLVGGRRLAPSLAQAISTALPKTEPRRAQ